MLRSGEQRLALLGSDCCVNFRIPGETHCGTCPHRPRAEQIDVLQTWQAELDERIRRLQQVRDAFADCIGCGCMSIDRCPLANPDDILGQRGPGPSRLDP